MLWQALNANTHNERNEFSFSRFSIYLKCYMFNLKHYKCKEITWHVGYRLYQTSWGNDSSWVLRDDSEGATIDVTRKNILGRRKRINKIPKVETILTLSMIWNKTIMAEAKWVKWKQRLGKQVEIILCLPSGPC